MHCTVCHCGHNRLRQTVATGSHDSNELALLWTLSARVDSRMSWCFARIGCLSTAVRGCSITACLLARCSFAVWTTSVPIQPSEQQQKRLLRLSISWLVGVIIQWIHCSTGCMFTLNWLTIGLTCVASMLMADSLAAHACWALRCQGFTRCTLRQ